MPETMTQWWLSSATPSVDTLRVWVAALGLLVAGGVTVKQWRSARVFELIVPVALGLLAVGRALQNAWIADDAYISFRFAANWANGLGPVWNAGERVEGYTNPLWVALAALGEWLGAPAPHLMSGLNLLVTFVFIDNIPSIKGCKKAGFEPYTRRYDRWRYFRRKSTFTQISASE